MNPNRCSVSIRCAWAAGDHNVAEKTKAAAAKLVRWERAAAASSLQLAPVTSPLVGEVGSRGKRANREGGTISAESARHPPPHPSPTRGEGAERGSVRVKCDSPA